MADDLELVWCESVWCGLVYVQSDGWGGLCPSCVALVDEHLATRHTRHVRECRECHRTDARLVRQRASA